MARGEVPPALRTPVYVGLQVVDLIVFIGKE